MTFTSARPAVSADTAGHSAAAAYRSADPGWLDGQGIVAWAALVVERLGAYREQINSLNVFPVPDSDTGTNMLHTMRSAVDHARRSTGADSHTAAGARDVAIALGQGAVRGARGNSGIILSQVLRALGESASFTGLDAQTFKRTLRSAVILVEHALSEPVEGTIVTVLREAAAAAQQSQSTVLAHVARVSADAAAEALARTPLLLPVLSTAGVVDAGGRGLLVLLDSLVEILDGDAPDRPNYTRDSAACPEEPAAQSLLGEGHTGREDAPGDGTPQGTAAACAEADQARFEVMYSVHLSTTAKTDTLRDELTGVGESVIVVGDGAAGDLARWSVHVHCNDIGAAIELGLAAGAVSDIRVTELIDERRSDDELAGRAVIAVVDAGPLAGTIADAGARPVAPTSNPHALVEEVLAVHTRELIVLPNGALTSSDIAVVDAELRAHGRHVIILPTQSIVQGLAALAVHDPNTSLSLDGFAMADAASSTRFARLDTADSAARTVVGPCKPGDILGYIGHDVAVVSDSPATALHEIVTTLVAFGGEMLTIIATPHLPDTLVSAVTDQLRATHPDLEIVTYRTGGGDALAYIGVE